MCTNPIRISNRTRGYKEGHTKAEMYVPCGKCDECRMSKADQWHLRIYDTIEEYDKIGGASIFATFTYDEEHLPKYYYTHEDGSERYFPCFSKLHKDTYIRSVQDYFRYHLQHRPKVVGKDDLGLPQYNDYPVRFFWASEYGLDMSRTQRPHYHVIFSLPPRILALYGRDEEKWKKFFRSLWPYGMTRYSPKNSIFVNSEFAGLYVSKYVNKSIDFYNQKLVKEYFDQAYYDGVKDEDKYKLLKDKVKDLLPKHWQSPYYGAGLIKKFNNKDAYIYGVDFHFTGEREKGQSRRHSIPQYIERRMLTTWDNETNSYKLTEKGIDFKMSKFMEVNYAQADKYNQLLDRRFVKMLLGEDFDFRSNKILSRFENFEELYEYITSILVNVSTSLELVLYNRVWSGVPVDYQDLLSLDSLNVLDFINESIRWYHESLYLPFDDYIEEGYFFVKSLPYLYKYDDCKRFTGFSQALKVFGELYNVNSRRISKEYNEKYLKKKQNKFNIKTA